MIFSLACYYITYDYIINVIFYKGFTMYTK